MTLRQALQLLADDGLIGTRHGSGTYVAHRYAYDLGHLRSFASDLAGQGAPISTRLLGAGIVTRAGGRGRPARRARRGAPAAPPPAGRRAAADRADVLAARGGSTPPTAGPDGPGRSTREWPSAACTRCWPSTGWP